jgi:shikimate dehydrogenase
MKLYGLIGFPLGHSFSKKYFTEKFQLEGLTDCNYEAFPLPSIKDLPSVISSNPFLKGLNGTIPYKQDVLDYASELSDVVKKIGAANTLKIKGNNIIAYNTDVIGFEKSFIKKLQPSHKKAIVLGTGGASKAVKYVLKKLGIDFLNVSRNTTRELGFLHYNEVDENVINEYPVIINCTPVGTYPDIKESPQLPYSFISEKHYLFDVVYNPEKSLFLTKGEERGAVIQNGYEMLVIQAEESWKIWNED